MSFTMDEMVTRIREASDTVQSGKPLDSECVRWANYAGAELAEIVASSHGDHLLTSTTFTITDSAFPSASLPSDFVRERLVEFTDSSGCTDSCDPFSLQDRSSLMRSSSGLNVSWPLYRLSGPYIEVAPPAAAVGTYTLWYVCGWTSVDVSDTLDDKWTIQSFDEFIVVSAAQRVLMTQGNRQGDADALDATKQEMAGRIKRSCAAREASGRSKMRTTSNMLSGLTFDGYENYPYNNRRGPRR